MEGRSRIDVFISQSMIVGIDEVLEGERGKNLLTFFHIFAEFHL